MFMQAKNSSLSLSIIVLITTVLLVSVLTGLGTGSRSAAAQSAVPELFIVDRVIRSGRSAVVLDEGVTQQQQVSLNLSVLSAEQIRLNPFPELDVIAQHQKTTFGAGDSFVWQGTLADEPFSEVYLSFKDGVLVGSIHRASGETYQLKYAQNHYLLQAVELPHLESEIIQSEASTATLDAPAALPQFAAPQSRGRAVAATQGDGSTVTLMVLYTPDARDAAGGTAAIEAEINMVMAKNNQAAVNSQLNFSFLLVHTGEISASEEVNYPGGLINRIWANAFPEVKYLRDLHAADIVSIWAHDKPDGAAGIAFQFGEMDMRQSELAYNQVRRAYAINTRTMIHEIGHNMAAGHGVYSLTSQLQDRIHPYAFGYGSNSAGFYTIMGANVSPTQTMQINYFSNPNVFTNGVPMGSVYSATLGYGENNVRAMNEVAYLVSNYRLSPPTDQTLVVDTVIDDSRLIGCLDGVPNDCSLRGAVRLVSADVTTRPYTITLSAGQTYTITAISLEDDYGLYGDFDVKANVTIEGNGAAVSGNYSRRVFDVIGSGSSLTLRDITLRHGNGSFGGAIQSEGPLTLINSEVINSTSGASGGGIFASNAVVLINSTLRSCTSRNQGGGISTSGPLTLNNSHVLSNTARSSGGGIYADNSVTLVNSTVQNNQASLNRYGGGSGGGISQRSGTLTVTDSIISGNKALPPYNGLGGGISTNGTAATIVRSTITSNTTPLGGSGIYASGSLTVISSTISHNQGLGWAAGGWPSAILGRGPTVVRDSSIIHNMGGVAVENSSLHLINSTASQNDGHGVWLKSASSTAFITNTTIVSNTNSGIFGGWNQATQTQVYGSIIGHNLDGSCQGNLLLSLSQGYNLLGDASCGFSAVGDVVDSNTLLGPLALNGGLTANHMPHSGSPARDTISAADCLLSNDQRGVPRPFNTNCDKGAVESNTETIPVSPTVSISVTAGIGVNLNWAAYSSNCNYTIYRSSNPYTGFAVLGTANIGPYLDTNGAGNGTANYFYRVAASSCPARAQTADSKTMALFNFALQPGN